jgi:predicted nuclease of predicted toxin-antitoxin system
MRFLVDECTGPTVARWLRQQGHVVFSVYDDARGMEDHDVIEKAFTESWLLITNDKGFGEKIFRQRRPRHGVILLRLEDERSVSKIDVLRRLLHNYGDQIADRFVVATERSVRFART